jgi:purine-nucleoside phosphorylase
MKCIHDPLRTNDIAETYLENPVLVTPVRNMPGFTVISGRLPDPE